MADISSINLNNITYNIKDIEARNNIISITSNYLPISGGTLAGALTAKGNQYNEETLAHGLNMNNSNIVGINALYYSSNEADAVTEGIHFLRNNGNYDSLRFYRGVIYFTPNRPPGTTTALSDSQLIPRFTQAPTAGQVILTNSSGGAIHSTQYVPIANGGTGAATSTGALTNLGALPLSGGTLSGNLIIDNSKYLAVRSATTNGLTSVRLYLRGKGQSHGNNLSFWYENPSGSGATLYQLPEVNESTTTNNYYNILTSQEPVTIAQGGTGVTTLNEIRNELYPDSGSKALTNTEVFTGTIYYRKIGSFVQLNAYQIRLVSELAANGNIVLGTLPSGYRPSQNTGVPMGNRGKWGSLLINSSGTLLFYADSNKVNTTDNLHIHLVYIAA